MSNTNYSDYIYKQLMKLSKTRKVEFSSDKIYAKMICCNPLHKGGKEATPSLQINIKKRQVKNRMYLPGSGKCFSCDMYYSNWQKIAQAIDRPDLAVLAEDAARQDEEVITSFFNDDTDEAFIAEQDEEAALMADLKDSVPWNKNEDWRGIKGIYLHEIQAKMYFNSKIETTMLYLPCHVNGEEVGGTRCNLVKRGKNNYFNTPGPWVKDFALFHYDLALSILKRKKLKTLVLVEGARDALNFLQNDIPTMGILGSNNWSEVKADLVLSTGVEKVITAFDPDSAGDKAKVMVYTSLKDQVSVKNFSFENWQQKLGLKEKLDPGNSPLGIIEALKRHVV